MIYPIIAILLFLFSLLLPSKKSKSLGGDGCDRKFIFRFILFLSCVFLVLFEGLRWEIGTDWQNYYDYFLNLDNIHMDWGYEIFTKFFRLFSESYSLFLIVISGIIYLSIFLLLERDSINPIMSLCIYFCLMLGLLGCNRQLLAMAICILSLPFIYKRRFVEFILCILIAFSFHKTAILFFPAYFIYGTKVNLKLVTFFVALCFFLGLSGIVDKVPYVEYLSLLDSISSSNFTSYVGDEAFGVSIFGSFKRIIFIVLGLIALRRKPNTKYFFFFNLYLIGSCIFLCFNGSVLQLMASRGTLYYNVFECLLIPFVITYIPIKNKKIVWTLFFVFYIYVMQRDMDSYFLQIGIDIFRPYKCVINF